MVAAIVQEQENKMTTVELKYIPCPWPLSKYTIFLLPLLLKCTDTISKPGNFFKVFWKSKMNNAFS